MKYNNILVTATNSAYFNALLTQINSFHKYNFDLIDQLIVYDIGLTQEDKDLLNTMAKVTIKDFSGFKLPYPDYLLPKGYAYKCYCPYNERDNAKRILWLDSGAAFLRNAQEIFDIIENENILLVEDTNHLNKDFTKKKTIQIMNATDKELNAHQLWAGILGYKPYGKYHKLFEDCYNYSLIDGCIVGNEENSRHDQSVYSILASRYNCPKQDINIFGYWTNNRERNYQAAKKMNAIIYVHRRGFHNANKIIHIKPPTSNYEKTTYEIVLS